MIPVLVFTLLYNVPKFFELYTERVAVDEAGLQLANVTLAEANQGTNSVEFHFPMSTGLLILQKQCCPRVAAGLGPPDSPNTQLSPN